MNAGGAPRTMTREEAGRVCMPFGKLIGWRLSAVAERRPLTFCRMMRGRRRYYGDLRVALDALFGSPLHAAAKREKERAAKEAADRDLLDRARG